MNAERSHEPDTELLREALGGLFGIAREDNPPEVLDSLRTQIDGLPARECERLLDEMVDTDRLKVYLDKAEGGEGIRSDVPAFGDDEMRKVDAVLDPLARLERGDEGARSLQQLEPDQRAHILFEAINRSQTSR